MARTAAYELPAEGAFDNHPRPAEHIEAIPLTSAMGAEIRGVDLADVSDCALDEVKAALYHHKMIFFREQALSFEAQEQLTERFGAFGVDAFTDGVEGHPYLQRVIKEATDRRPMVFGGTWHTDSAFLACPPAVSILYGREVPPFGGDTWWANTELAYAFLSDTMKAMIDHLKVRMSSRRVVRGIESRRSAHDTPISSLGEVMRAAQFDPNGELHPLVRTHPETGRRALYVDQTYSVGIEGLNKNESKMLIDFLVDHIIQPVFTCRLRWESGTVAMWDNRQTLHHAFNDYDGYRREMFRTIVQGERPC